MRVTHRRTTGKQLEYTIDADTLGGYVISLGDKVLRSVGGEPGFNTRRSKAKQELAIAAARTAIEQLRGMQEE